MTASRAVRIAAFVVTVMTVRRAVLLTGVAMSTLGTVFLAVPVAAEAAGRAPLECGSGLDPADPLTIDEPGRLGLSACGQVIADRQTACALTIGAGVATVLGGLAMRPSTRRRHRKKAPARPGTRPGARGPRGCPR